MPTPPMLTFADLIGIWNEVAEQATDVPLDPPGKVPGGADAVLRYPTGLNHDLINLMFAFTYRSLEAYSSRLGAWLHEKNLT